MNSRDFSCVKTTIDLRSENFETSLRDLLNGNPTPSSLLLLRASISN